MPTPAKGPRLGGTPAHDRIIMRNLASQLLEHGRVVTTITKAKRVRPLAEKLITRAKVDTVANRRIVNKTITDRGVVHVLFTQIAPAMEGRDGGYTRITRIGNRQGDNAPMAVIEIITDPVTPRSPATSQDAKDAISQAAAKDEEAEEPKAEEAKAEEATEAAAEEPAAEDGKDEEQAQA